MQANAMANDKMFVYAFIFNPPHNKNSYDNAKCQRHKKQCFNKEILVVFLLLSALCRSLLQIYLNRDSSNLSF